MVTGLQVSPGEALDTDGVAVVRGAIPERWLRHLEGAVDAAMASPTPLGHQFKSEHGAFVSDMYLSTAFEAFAEFGREGPVAELVGRLAGWGSVTLFTDEMLVKAPNTTLKTPWHHDLSYWPLDGWSAVSAWIPLDPVRRDSGALEFVQGSHRSGRRYHPLDFGTSEARVTSERERPLEPADVDPHRETFCCAELDPGDLVIFHALTLHRASGTPGCVAPRRAVVLRLVGPDVVYDPRPRTLPLIWAPRLKPGDPLGGELFPTLWREGGADHGHESMKRPGAALGADERR